MKKIRIERRNEEISCICRRANCSTEHEEGNITSDVNWRTRGTGIFNNREESKESVRANAFSLLLEKIPRGIKLSCLSVVFCGWEFYELMDESEFFGCETQPQFYRQRSSPGSQ